MLNNNHEVEVMFLSKITSPFYASKLDFWIRGGKGVKEDQSTDFFYLTLCVPSHHHQYPPSHPHPTLGEVS